MLIIPQLISISLFCTLINNTINISNEVLAPNLYFLFSCCSALHKLLNQTENCQGRRLQTKPLLRHNDKNTQRLYSDEGMLYHFILVPTAQSQHRLARGYESLRDRCAVCACALLTTPLFVPYVSKLLLCLPPAA